MSKTDAERTGWAPGMLQDDSRELSTWLATRVDSRKVAREACASIKGAVYLAPESIKGMDDMAESMGFLPRIPGHG